MPYRQRAMPRLLLLPRRRAPGSRLQRLCMPCLPAALPSAVLPETDCGVTLTRARPSLIFEDRCGL